MEKKKKEKEKPHESYEPERKPRPTVKFAKG